MKSLHKKFGVLAVAAAMAAGVAGNAQAGVLGQSVLEITNFRFLNATTSAPLTVGDFSFLQFADSSTITANLNGTIASNSVNSSSFGTLDNPQQCVGNCGGFPANDYSHRLAPSTVNVARGDSLLQGAPIISGGTFPADAHVVAEGQLTSVLGNGNIEANLALTASFQFRLAAAQNITVAMDSNSHLIAAVDLGSRGTARATESWTLDVVDAAGTTVFHWAPDGVVGTGITGGTETADGCNLQVSRGAQLPAQTAVYDCSTLTGPPLSGHHSATTALLQAGQTYTLNLTHANHVDVTRVPEPGTLLLLGIGLAGLGFGVRRGKRAA